MAQFGEFIKTFLAVHEITIGELAACLEYKSKTSLQRLTQGQYSGESTRRFAEKLREKFVLTNAENKELDDCVMRSMLGSAVFEAEREMWAFLQGGEPDDTAVIIENMESGVRLGIYETYRESTDIKISIFNCPYIPVCGDIRRLINDRGAHVLHYMLMDMNNARTIRMMNTVMTLLFERRYDAFAVSADSPDSAFVPSGIMRADMLLCEHTDAAGARRDDIIVFDGRSHGRLVSHLAAKLPFIDLFLPDLSMYHPIKQTFIECGNLSDYIEFSKDFARMEFNKPLYKIKPDVCVDYIPGDILGAALREGPIPHEAGFDEVADILEDIYTKRNIDAFTRRKPSYVIFKKTAMWNLAKTGRSMDHFWGMRAYTPKERARIISGLLKQQLENPYMHMYFLTDDSLVRDANINFCEGAGLLILDENTDYKLSDRHSNVLVHNPEFSRLYKKFMLGYLVPKYVYPESETCAIFEDLIDYCKSLAAQ